MSKQGTKIKRKNRLNCPNGILDLNNKCIMGILNVSPDSFYDGGKNSKPSKLLKNCEKLIEGGAAIIDLGAASSRPGSKFISIEEEFRRIVPSLKLLRATFPTAIFSIDTWRSEIAKTCLELGADIINDISGGALDKNMYKTVAAYKVPYIIMHMPGAPENMQSKTKYKNVTKEVFNALRKKKQAAMKAGVKQIILDPGFGFGKTTEQNYSLLKHLKELKKPDIPVLVGMSRKSMITKVLKINPEDAINGTSVLNAIALLNGADILRVHDAKEANEVSKLINFYLSVL